MALTVEHRRNLILVVLSAVIGLVAVVMLSNYLNKEVETRQQKLADDIQKNIKLEIEKNNNQIRTEMSGLEQKVSKNLINASGERPGIVPQSSLALKTPAGKRAVTVKMDSLAAVGGLIQPGDYVDVLAQLIPPGNPAIGALPPKVITAMIFQNIQVLAVNTNVSAPGVYEIQQQARELIITLSMDPEEAGLVSFVQQNGKLQLALRSPSETETQTLSAANWQTLADYVLEKQGTDLGSSNTKTFVEPTVEEAQPKIQIYRGGKELY